MMEYVTCRIEKQILAAANGPTADYITGPNRVNTMRGADIMAATKH